MDELGSFRHLAQIGGEGELAGLAAALGQELAHRGPGDVDGGLELRFRHGRDVMGDDVESADEETRRPACTDEAGSRDANGTDVCAHARPLRFSMFRASSEVATLEPRSAMIFAAFSTRVPFEA